MLLVRHTFPGSSVHSGSVREQTTCTVDPIDLQVFCGGEGRKMGCTDRMCPVQVPGGGFQVAGCSVCPVSPEQTPHPKREGGKKAPR